MQPTVFHKRIDGYMTETETYKMMWNTAMALGKLSMSSIGPTGGLKMIQSNAECTGTISVTSTSSRLFSQTNINLNSYVARVLIETAKSQSKREGDCGLFTLGLCTSLLRGSLTVGVPKPLIVQALILGLSWSLEYLHSNRCPCRKRLSWADLDGIIAVLRGLLSPKRATGLLKTEQKFVATLILRAFIASLGNTQVNTSVNPTKEELPDLNPNVRVVSIMGAPTTSSCMLANTAVLNIPLPVDAPRELAHVCIALFDVSLRIGNTSYDTVCTKYIDNDFNDTANTKNNNWSTIGVEYDKLRCVAKHFISLGVGVFFLKYFSKIRAVLSQRLIHPTLKALLLHHGILPLERLSLRYIDVVRAVTGARVLSAWDPNFDDFNLKKREKNCNESMSVESTLGIPTDALGWARSIKVLKIGTKEFVALEGGLGEASEHTTFASNTTQSTLFNDSNNNNNNNNDNNNSNNNNNNNIFDDWCKVLDCTTKVSNQNQNQEQKMIAIANRARKRSEPSSTILLCAANQVSLDELRCVVDRCILVLSKLLQTPYVLAGAGCVEIHLSQYIRKRTHSTYPFGSFEKNDKCIKSINNSLQNDSIISMRRVLNLFADSLEEMTRSTFNEGYHNHQYSDVNVVELLCQMNNETLAGGVRCDESGLLIHQNTHHNNPNPNTHHNKKDSGDCCDAKSGRKMYGWNSELKTPTITMVAFDESGEENDLPSSCNSLVFDSLAAKCDALQTAVETTVTLIRVNGIIVEK